MQLFLNSTTDRRAQVSAPESVSGAASSGREGSALLDDFIRDQEIMSEVERLLSGRTRDIRLKGALAAAFRRRNWRQSASVIRSWMIWVVLIDLFMLVQSTVLLPREVVLAIVAPSALIVPAALGVALVWRKPRPRPILDWTLLAGMAVILLSVAWMGAAAAANLPTAISTSCSLWP